MTDQSTAVTAELPESLTARVLERVHNARVAADHRASATRSGSKRRRPQPTRSLASPRPEDSPESKSLRRVFRDFGSSYRRYRSQTGARVVPGLRAAAYKFRAEPSLTSLVAVAAFLDELDLLS
jgi:hypothetical protein